MRDRTIHVEASLVKIAHFMACMLGFGHMIHLSKEAFP